MNTDQHATLIAFKPKAETLFRLDFHDKARFAIPMLKKLRAT